MRAKGLLAQLLVEPRQTAREELTHLCGDILEVFVVVESVPPAIDLRRPHIADISGDQRLA
jgi:hypothetical protein